MSKCSVALIALAWVGCTGDGDPTDNTTPPTGDSGTETTEGPVTCKSVERTNCVEIAAGDSAALQDAVNSLEDDTAIVLAEGTYLLDNQVTVRGATGVTLIGQGIDETILDFSPQKTQANGVDMLGNDMHIEGLTINESRKDGLRIEESDGVVIRAVKVTWENEDDTENGAYGIYPVRVSHVLMEDSEAYNASDAGIYVGQCQHAVVRNNTAKQNVAGIEIENTQFAEVYGNLAEDNTGGLVVFDLPGNPVIGRDVRIFDNQIINNNRGNFAAPGTTVSLIPPGTGTFAMASRRVEITGNTYRNNNTTDVALVSGYIVEGNDARWYIANKDIVGDITGLEKDLYADKGGIHGYRTFDIHVHGNTHSGSGDDPTLNTDNLGSTVNIFWALHTGLGGDDLATVLYDSISESAFHPTVAGKNSNDNRICVGKGQGSTMMTLDLEAIDQDIRDNGGALRAEVWVKQYLYRPDVPYAPYDCTGPALIAPDMDVD